MNHCACFLKLAEILPEAMLLVSIDGVISSANEAAGRLFRTTGPALQGESLADDPSGGIRLYLRRCSRSRELLPGVITVRGADGAREELSARGARFDGGGEGHEVSVLLRLQTKTAANAVFLSLNRKLVELSTQRRKLEEKSRTIDKQRAEILALSAPIIDVWDDVLLLPLIGDLDTERMERVMTSLLWRITETRARWVILDLTGAPYMAGSIMASVVGVAQAARLLGARCILTGLRPELVQALIAEGPALLGVITMRSLKDAIRYCAMAKHGPQGI